MSRSASQGYLIAQPMAADKLLPVLAALPNHMQSLLLTSPALRPATKDAAERQRSSQSIDAPRRRALAATVFRWRLHQCTDC